MKKIIVLCMVLAMTFSLAACGGATDEGGMENDAADVAEDKEAAEEVEEVEETEEDTYEEQTFMLHDWEVTITKDELVYEDYYECDDLVVYVTVVNTRDEARKFSDIANILAYQNGETLDWGQAQDADGEFLANTMAFQEETASGESVSGVYGWALADDSTVTVNFGGNSSDIVDTPIEFEVKDRITDDWKETLETQAEEMEAKQSETGFDILGVTGEIAEGWYLEESAEKHVKIVKEGMDLPGNLDIDSSTSRGTAQEWAQKTMGNFSMTSSETRTIGTTNYIYLQINDDQFALYADSSDGAAVEIYGMFITYDEAVAQLEKITLK